MSKAKNIKEENVDNKQKSREEEIIDRFIWRNDSDIEGRKLYSFPLMMRLDKDHMARLDHLAKVWKITRSGLACEMLKEMIDLIMTRYYQDKTPEEYKMIQREAWDEFSKKIEATRKRKEKK
ncbi:MAG: hypothetical protein ABSF13_08880 [Smithella sp.]